MRHPLRAVKSGFAFLTIAALAAGQVATCPGSGLSVTGGRFGDAFTLDIEGPPGAPGILAADVAGGLILTPYGTLGLGLTPSLATSPLTLDATGKFGLAGTLPLAPTFAAGSTQYVQAALAHPSLPGGFALTNGAAVTFRPPRLGVFRWSAYTGTSIDLIDGVTDSVAVSIPTTVWPGSRVVHVPRLGWYAWPTAAGEFHCVDDFTGATALTIPNVWTMGGGSWDVSDDGAYLFVTMTGASQVYNRVLVRTYELPSGTMLSQQSIPSLNFVNRGVYAIPGTALAYVASADRYHVVDGAAGIEVGTIFLPGSLSGYADRGAFPAPGGMLYTIVYTTAGNTFVAIDTSAHAITATSAIPAPANWVAPFALGPGATGPALWCALWIPGSSMQIAEVSLATMATVTFGASIPLWPTRAQVSAGGTEMLFQLPPSSVMTGGPTVVVNCTTHAVTTITGLGDLGVLRSDTLTKAYAYCAATGLASILTDPVGGGGSFIPLPPGMTAISQTQLVSN